MPKLYVEHRTIDKLTEIPGDIADHLLGRINLGAAAVITNRPEKLLRFFTLEWAWVLHRDEMAAVKQLSARELQPFSENLKWLRSLHCSLKEQLEDPGAQVYFNRPDEVFKTPPVCKTLYTLVPLPTEDLQQIASNMSQGGVLVLYTLAETVRAGLIDY